MPAQPGRIGIDNPINDLPRVIRVGPDHREAAITRLLAHSGGVLPGHAQRFMEYAEANHVDLGHLWGIPDGSGGFVAVVLAVLGAGRSAMVYASQGDDPTHHNAATRILHTAAAELGRRGVLLAQALIDPHEHVASQTFHAGGFSTLATLSYLERSLRSRTLPRKPVWPTRVTVESCERVSHDELIDVLDASYEDTLDCPGLRGHRSTKDILDGHLAQGRHDPRLWTLLRREGKPVGVLLLNPAADASSIELVYLGLAVSARGCGLGLQLLRHGLHLVAHRRERVMTLAVDEANVPALRLYARENFRTVMRRVALIRGLHAQASCDDHAA